MSKKLINCILILMLFASCNSYNKLTYLQDIAETQKDSIYLKNKPNYKIQPGDILYVRVISGNEEIDRLFNYAGTQGNMASQGSLYLTGYSVNDSGYIEVPVLKKIHVSDLTIEQAKEKITRKAAKYLKDAQIIVKLASFKFTVLGEVSGKGVKEVPANQVNILEALGHAGGINYNGNRKNILILRPNKNGTQTFRVDVTDEQLVSSELYYILPNDIIYVEPLKATLFRERTSDYLFLLSTITTTLTAVVLILNLIK